MSSSTIDSAVKVARALGHPARLRTIAMLRSGELCVCQITEVLKLAPSTVSAHLKELKLAGLTEEHKQGRWIHVGLTGDADLRDLIAATLAQLKDDPQLAEDGAFVAELRKVAVEDLCRLGFRKASIEMGRRTAAGS